MMVSDSPGVTGPGSVTASLSHLEPSSYVPWDAPMPPPVGRPIGGVTAAFDRALSHLRARPEWGKSPEYVQPATLVPPPLEGSQKPLHDAGTQLRIRRVVRAARVRAAQQGAIEAPFEAIAKDKWNQNRGGAVDAHASEASGRGRGVALGLVSNETSDTPLVTWNEKRRLREQVELDRQAARIKRMKTSVGHAARLLHFDAHQERHAQRWNKKFITLTYADVDAWEPGHFTAFRKAMGEWCRRRNVRFRFVWVGELQERGALHYHVVVWLPKGKYLPHADACGWWPHGMTNIKTAESPIGYITKYASKTTPAQALGYPKGARMCGHGGLTPEGRRHIRYWHAPFWVRDELTGRADIRKVVGGYMDKITGEFLPSPWRVEIGPDGRVFAYRIDQPSVEQAA